MSHWFALKVLKVLLLLPLKVLLLLPDHQHLQVVLQ
jgi:hypothetical protein